MQLDISKIQTKINYPKNRITKKSFYDACVEKNRLDILDRWDYEMNDDPKFVAHQSKKSIYLKCPCGRHESSIFCPEHIFNPACMDSKCIPCPKCNSFAQWGIDEFGDDFLEKYWDFEKNCDDPWVLPKQSNKKIWLKCNKVDYHPSYDIVCSGFFNGKRCPYCKGRRIALEDSLATSCPNVVNLWSNKNNVNAYKISPSSSKKVWWKCESGKHDDYFRSVKDSRRYNFRCPKCSRSTITSSYQKKAVEELNKYGYTLLYEENCTLNPINSTSGRKMRYDIEAVEIRLICEVNGAQHYNQDKYFTSSLSKNELEVRFQELKRRDKVKKEYAILHGYTYLELPYTAFSDDTYVRLIRDAILAAQKAVSA